MSVEQENSVRERLAALDAENAWLRAEIAEAVDRRMTTLRDSEARLQAIADSVDQMIWSTRPDGYHDYYNRRWYEYTGAPEGSTDGAGWSEMFHPDDRERTWQVWRHSLETGEPYHIEYRLRHRSGSYRWVLGRAQPVRDAEGRITRWYGTCTDIHDLKAAEERLRLAEERYRLILEATSDAIWDWDLVRDQVSWSEALHVAHGHRPETVERTGAWWLEQIHPDDRPRVSTSVHDAFEAGGSTWADEYRFRRADGSYADILDRGTVIRDASGRAVRMIGAMLDVSGRKRAEAALRESETRLRLATEAGSIGTWDYDLRSDRLEWDARCRALFGVPADAPVSYASTFLAALHPDDRPRTEAAVAAALQPGSPGFYDIEFRAIGLADGVERWIAANGRAHFADGRATRFIGTVRDITARKEAESALAASEQALRQESTALEVLNRTAAQVAAELDLDRLVQIVIDAGVQLTGAAFGAFFYNAVDDEGEHYTLYALSGVDRAEFSRFPMPRNTPVFAPTFGGDGVVRSADITRDPRYGHEAPHFGMPAGHLPVRSYLAVPVVSRTGNVIGGLFFGHPETGVFTERAERTITGLAAQAAIGIDNASLFKAAQHEIGERKRAEQIAQDRSARLEILAEAIERAPSAGDLDELMRIVGEAAHRLSGADGVAFVLREGDQVLYASEMAPQPLWKGQRFPIISCISGWSMLHGKTVSVSDIRLDPRIPLELYEPTFVRSLVMVPLMSEGEANAAIGAYWGEPRAPKDGELATLEALARSAGAVLRRLEAEAALRRLNERLETEIAERTADRNRMWQLSTDVMLVARFDAVITAVNPAWRTLFGWSEAEMIGRSFLEFLHPEDRAATEAEMGGLAEGQPTLRFENRYRAKDGSYRWLSWTAVPDAHFVHAVGRDVTAEKLAAAALRESEDQLRQAQKMETVGQLTGGVAHDFNNLLQIVTGNLDILLRNLPGEAGRLRRAADNAMTGARRAATLTQRLLAFSRRQPLAPKPTDVNKLVHAMSELLHRTLGETIDIETVLASGLWRVEVDPNQLENAILNLAVNARDAMPEGGKLTIETSNTHLDRNYVAQNAEVVPGQYVAICVSDTGLGMDADTVLRAFEPFFTTKEVGKGTGLGLSMVYGFVKQSGGHVKVYSEPGHGTTVRIYLPRLLGTFTEEEELAAPIIPEGTRSETILVVEDDDDVRAYSVEVLRELGYRVIEAADGPAALRLLERPEPAVDLMFTDVVLPSGMTGAVLAERARMLRPALKVLFTTGYARNAIVHHGRLDPGVELLTKPFSYADLAARIRDMLDGPS